LTKVWQTITDYFHRETMSINHIRQIPHTTNANSLAHSTFANCLV